MSRSIEFRTSLTIQSTQWNDIPETVDRCVAKLKLQRPEVARVKMAIDPQDRCAKIGAGYRVKINGTILFKPGPKPDLIKLHVDGATCFNHDFELLEPST